MSGTLSVLGSDDMEQLAYSLKRLIPDQLDIFYRRYQILKAILKLQPTGRRSVALYLGISERNARGEIEKLSQEGFIEIQKTGMSLTKAGLEILEHTGAVVRELLGYHELEDQLRTLLSVKKVIVVEGNSELSESAKREIGVSAAHQMLNFLNPDSTIGLTGGSTMAYLVESIPSFQGRKARLVVPARGSVGHKVSQQSDTLAEALAKKLNAQCRLLNIPDSLSMKAMNEIKNEPSIQDALTEMHKADVIVFGIGEALDMAKKRRVPEPICDYLVRKEAIGEAFGYYFNEAGQTVYSSRSMSISLDEVKKIPSIIAVAGGPKKALAIIAVSKNLKNAILVLDEAAAEEILTIIEKNKIE